ncbi:TIGR02646 family protein [Polyangium spumosum]|uniref:TIGR02646 family protein n=1 Tax=Polyangium spumosum TaxID=889282 RepID=A0A6N7PVF7_9BACT|nr:TIGR02646 family protein [Polyangium spumosum]MRG92791.1 TIGR02646 family protein [Polyangium spumosum]
MRVITKGPEPSALRNYRAVPGAIYDGKDFTPVKVEIREALIRDQDALCCYCMRGFKVRPHRTDPDASPVAQMKVEHWRSQRHFPALQLAWTNLLGACLGGEGSPKNDQTCDTRKGEDAISLNPLDKSHVATLRCGSDGRLESTEPRFQEDIDKRLGLNHPILVSERKAWLKRAHDKLRAKHKGEFPLSAVRALSDALEEPARSVLQLWTRKRYGNS